MEAEVLLGRELVVEGLLRPEVGWARVQSILMVVDFPAPFGPRKANTSPWATEKSISLTATRSP
jgi:hypothetical protein